MHQKKAPPYGITSIDWQICPTRQLQSRFDQLIIKERKKKPKVQTTKRREKVKNINWTLVGIFRDLNVSSPQNLCVAALGNRCREKAVIVDGWRVVERRPGRSLKSLHYQITKGWSKKRWPYHEVESMMNLVSPSYAILHKHWPLAHISASIFSLSESDSA